MDRLTSDKSCQTYSEFTDMVRARLLSAWGKDNISFCAAWPSKEESSGPLITHRIQEMVEGEPMPRQRDQITEDGKSFKVYGQKMKYLVRFDIWADTGEQADIVTEQFIAFMREQSGYLMKNGVKFIRFKRQVNDTDTQQWRVDLMNRTLNYEVHLDMTYVEEIPLISEIDVELG
ncbi:MAG: hypothetical protein NWF07_13065 [Candidatus Bathyarchaeota archaeon]|nr:hypothetical protein [Candidatus Bathyarchaeota archaeon]